MSQMQFNLKNLQELDNGKVMAMVNHSLRQIVADISDRPADKAKRKMVMEVVMTPRNDKERGVNDGANVTFIIKTLVPVRQTLEYPMLADRDHRLYFQPHSPDDPRQADLPYRVDEQTGEVFDDTRPDVETVE